MDNTKKNFIWNMVGATTNSFTSLVFMIIVTRINGTDIAGIFTFGFSLACLFQVISNYSGRTYQVTNIDDSLTDSDFVYNRITSCLLTFVFVIAYLFFKRYDVLKYTVILLFVLYRVIESFTDVMYGVVQKNNELYKVGISLFLKGILGTAVFFITDWLLKDITITIISLLIVNFLIVILYDYRNFKVFYKKEKYNNRNNIRLFRLGVFVFGFTFLTQYILNAPKYAIDDYATNEMQTVYGIVSMPASFFVLCSQFVIQPLLVQFTEFIKNEKYRELLKLSIRIVFFIIGIGILGTVAAYFLGIPILELVYGIDLKDYLFPLLTIIAGATFFSISFAISNILTAMRKTFIQIVFYVICSLFIMFLSRYLVLNYGVVGGTLSYSATMLLLCILYLVYYLFTVRRKIKNA